jgi:hypothetical protein
MHKLSRASPARNGAGGRDVFPCPPDTYTVTPSAVSRISWSTRPNGEDEMAQSCFSSW